MTGAGPTEAGPTEAGPTETGKPGAGLPGPGTTGPVTTGARDGAVPRLRRGVRLTYDHTRERHVLLAPESVLVPNATAAAVLRLCDGHRSAAEIARALRARYASVPEGDVRGLLDRLARRRVIEWT